MDLGLNDKLALVTGAGSQIGFGKATCITLAKEGCDIIAADIDFEGAQKTADEVMALGRKAMAFKTDVTNADDWENMVKEVLDKFGKIDILVNNAGGCTPPRSFFDMTDDDWNFDINVNLTSTRLGTKIILPHMVERKYGKIVNVTSGAGMHGGMFTSGYSAAKAGVMGFTVGTAREAARSNININAVSPGVADTGFAKNAPPGMIENHVKSIPIGRITTQQDIANAIAFLVSDVSSDMVGQVLIISGDTTP